MSASPQLFFNIQYQCDASSLPSPKEFRRWVKAALQVDGEITLLITDRAQASELNQQYRSKDYAPNVLTFALTEHPLVMADIVICAPVVIKEAHQQHKDVWSHFAHMTVHGVLHAQGYDHEIEAQAELMEQIEIQTLAKLGYANPYASET